MNTKRPLALAAAVAALSAAPALAEPGHAAMYGPANAAGAGIAEGKLEKGVRTVEVNVTGDGFVPARIKANKGEKLRLVVTRKTDRTCATEIVVKDHGINRPLPLGKPVTVELTPGRSGEIRYACGMDMITGVIFVP